MQTPLFHNQLPPYFKSTGDYDSPTLIYLTVPSVSLFGLTEFATRFPVALFSLLTLPLLYLLCRRYLFKFHSVYLSLAAVFFYATSQWHILYSRSDFEAIIALFFIVINILLLFRGIEKKNPLHFYLAFIMVLLSALTYHADKIFAPLINVFFIALNWSSFVSIMKSELTRKKLRALIVFIILAILSYLFYKFYLSGPGAARGKMVFFTEDFEYKRALVEKISEFGMAFMGLPMLLLFWWKRFLEYFSPNFYLIDGLGLTLPGHPGSGILNIALFPFYFLGIFAVLVDSDKSKDQKTNLFILGWLILGFLPATIANNSQHALRSLNSSMPVIFLSVIGLKIVLEFIANRSKKLLILFLGLFTLIFTIDFVRFLDYYTVHYPYELSENRQYGWKEMAQFAAKVHSQYDNVYVDPRFGTDGRNNYGVPYLYFLFYSKYDPRTYQTFPGRERFISDFENYHFLEIDLGGLDKIKDNNLYIASPWSFPDFMMTNKYIVSNVKFLNGHVGFYAITNKPKK